MPEISHDTNFCFPVRQLENDRVKLIPFIPSQHAELFFQGSVSHPELYQFLPYGPFSSAAEYTKELIEGRIAPNPGMVLYAVIDKTRSPSPNAPPSSTDFAGTIGYLNASSVNLSTEIGFIIILPPFQRTHVTTNAFGLLLQYALDLPSASTPGLGLRRVQWQANEANIVSINLAEKMGLKKEGVLRWERVIPGDRGKSGNGLPLREGDPRYGTLGRHTVILAVCWDDWEEGHRERVLRRMDRRS